MSPQPEDITPPEFGALGQTPEEFERQRLRELDALTKAERLNEAQADRPMRENFGANEQESWDDPASTRETIAGMAAARAPALIRASRGLGVPSRSLEPPPPPTAAVPGMPAELPLMIRAVVGELSRELRSTLADLKEDIDANTRLLGVMNAPMEAITDSHERASVSFETLRKDIDEIARETPSALRDLARVMDTAGLNDAQSRAEKRFEALAREIHDSMRKLVDAQATAFKGIALDMTKILHLLERLQARELRDAKARAQVQKS